MKEWEQVACHDLLLVARDPPFLLVLQPMRCSGKLFLSGSFLAHCLGADCSRFLPPVTKSRRQLCQLTTEKRIQQRPLLSCFTLVSSSRA